VTVPPAPDDVLDFYGGGTELDRLSTREGKLEFERAKQIILRFLEPSSTVADVGGGVGRYAEWLAANGHRVELVDPVALHVKLAGERAGAPPSFGVRLADARALPFSEASFDAVLLFGPLYHLGDEHDRLLALQEAARVCRPGGVVFAIAISRFAPLLMHVRRGDIADERVFASVSTELRTGRRAPPADRVSTFPDAYFHLPSELRAEIEAAGLQVDGIYGLEGPVWPARNFDELWRDPDKRARLIELAAAAETDPELLASSLHFLAVARRVGRG
jgi:ubiquinone/menaquinone biosynthesis C-methylase UbiE